MEMIRVSVYPTAYDTPHALVRVRPHWLAVLLLGAREEQYTAYALYAPGRTWDWRRWRNDVLVRVSGRVARLCERELERLEVGQ